MFSIAGFHVLFQSTPPRRRRLKNKITIKSVCNFNPRLREGGDGNVDYNAQRLANFNPRLREGGDE